MSKLDWNRVHDYTADELGAFGFQRWDQSGLMLIPAALYDDIPAGLRVTSITGGVRAFDPTRDDDPDRSIGQRDQRYGVLAFGIIPKDRRS